MMNKNLPWANLIFLVISDHDLFWLTKIVLVRRVSFKIKKLFVALYEEIVDEAKAQINYQHTRNQDQIIQLLF